MSERDSPPFQRRLAAILAADVAGYSRLMRDDENATIRAWHTARGDVIDPTIARFEGRIVKHTGDGFLAEFATATDAVKCAIQIQEELNRRNAPVPPDRRMEFRMGINVGEITVDEEDIHGDGVNIAARLESIGEPGGVAISDNVFEQVERKIDAGLEWMGTHQVKNMAEPLSYYRVLLDGLPPSRHPSKRPTRAFQNVRNIPRHRMVAWLVLFFFLGVVGAAVWQTAFTSAVSPGPPSLTVNEFRTIGEQASNRGFSEGLTEDLITALSSNPNLRVISGRAALEGIQPPSERRQKRYILEGTVRGGVTIRITAQLVDAETGVHLWGGRYDRLLADPLTQQGEVSAKIVATLSEKFAQMEQDQAEAGGTIMSGTSAVLELLGRMAEGAVTLPGNVFARLFGDQGRSAQGDSGDTPSRGISTKM